MRWQTANPLNGACPLLGTRLQFELEGGGLMAFQHIAGKTLGDPPSGTGQNVRQLNPIFRSRSIYP